MHCRVEKLKYLGMVFTRDGGRNRKIGTRIGTANAVLHNVYDYVVTNSKLSNTVS